MDLAPSPALEQRLEATLDRAEIERANRFRFARHRRRFVLRRGAMRTLLGDYLGTAGAQLVFDEGPRGKPSVASGGRLRFNLSDSEDAALLAVTLDNELGVDIESVRSASDLEAIARRFFSDTEYRALMALNLSERDDGFYRAWTRKEAYLKAIGTGLHTPLSAFSVTLNPRQSARFLAIGDQLREAEQWTLHHLEPGPGFVGAIAIRRSGDRIITRHWSPEI